MTTMTTEVVRCYPVMRQEIVRKALMRRHIDARNKGGETQLHIALIPHCSLDVTGKRDADEHKGPIPKSKYGCKKRKWTDATPFLQRFPVVEQWML